MRQKKLVYDNLPVFLFSVAAVLVLVLSIFTNVLINYLSVFLRESIEERLLAASRSAAHLVSPEELAELMGPEDMEKPLFADIRERLIAFADESKLLFVYYLRPLEGDMWQFILDNDLSEDTVNLATEPILGEDVTRRAVREGRAVTADLGEYSPGYDRILSAFAPVFDGNGKIAALAGVDIPDDQLMLARRRTLVLSFMLLISIVFVITSGFLSFFVYKKNEALFSRRFKQQELMAFLARNFISAQDISSVINDALRITGEFLKTSRIFIGIAEANTALGRAVYWWQEREAHITAPVAVWSDMINRFPQLQPQDIPLIFCDDIQEDPRYRIMALAGVRAFIMVPLYLDGKFWAVLSTEECEQPRKWTESDRQLVVTASSLIAGAVNRDLREKERDAALTQAEQANQAKSVFLANMSHEIRTPLTAVIGMTSIAKSTQDAARKEYCLEKIENASNHLLGVINDILDMSKIEANKFELSCTDFDFEKMLRKVINVINFRMDEKHLDFTVHIGGNMPRVLHGDDQRLAQVITNLLSNAVKFTPEPGSIRLEAEQEQEEDGLCTLRISVADTGIGITEEQKPRLFSSFEQADSSTSRKFGGTGLGLSISKRIVEMMDGSIWVESAPGKGAVFSFRVKVKRGSGPEDGSAPEPPQGSPGDLEREDNFKGARILLAEDVEINREIVISLLEPAGLAIDCAENGLEAVDLFMQDPEKYDLIFMDIQMPEMDGYEASRRIRSCGLSRGKTIPIIAMTANVFREDIEKCLAAGMNAHVGKPLDMEEVLAVLRTHLPG
ncbi:MAG: response regulator [Spirochaetaceae bacterium]|jgi:signal transduction histidine kinase|nr:response regulator [Spirochaetaceae bacterium]